MRLKLEEQDVNKLPEGKVLTAEITSIKEVEKPWTDSRTGEPARRAAWEFTILDDEYAGRKVWEDLFTSFYPSDKCPMYVWTLKLLGREDLPEGFVLDTAAFEGSRVSIVLETRHFKKRDGSPGSAQQVNLLSDVEAASLRKANVGVESLHSALGGDAESTSTPLVEPAPSSPAPVYDDDSVEPF